MTGEPPRTIPPDSDPLGEALSFLRTGGALYCRSELTAPWGVELPSTPDALMFHVVIDGRCWVEVDGEVPQRLDAGHLGLVPHGRGHRIVSTPRVRSRFLFDLPVERVSERYEILRHGGGGTATTLLCGVMRFDHPAAADLVRLLPPVMCVGEWSGPEKEWVDATTRLVESETARPTPGGATVVARLADVLVAQAIRAWVHERGAAAPGWLGALRDPRIGRVVQLVHRAPGRRWSLTSMAREAGTSRSAFAERFGRLVGEPAMQHVTRWRMSVAVVGLRDDRTTVAGLAAQLGYDSEAAFSRAFRRTVGCWPTEARHRPPTSTSTSTSTERAAGW